ncbi:MAG: hypothetical protein CL792_01355 [Chloroflexi bacterium]|nr:hypothetical protein [Chloroflexota bacterium]|tara:strand:- start:862 stop:1851 length:990 start_codon:yes stop_codon:yes gene_type:complete
MRITILVCGFVSILAISIMILSCSSSETESLMWDAENIGRSLDQKPFVPTILNSNLGKGVNRISLGMFDDGQPIGGLEVEARIFQLGENPESNPSDAILIDQKFFNPVSLIPIGPHAHSNESSHSHVHDGAEVTVYIAYFDFVNSGRWGLALNVIDTKNDEVYEDLQISLFVHERTSEPQLGEIPPASLQALVSDVNNISEIDSSLSPNPDLHNMTIKEAIELPQPTLVAFVTPGFCQTKFCAPTMEYVVNPLYEKYGNKINFVHIEPFDLKRARSGEGLFPTKVVTEWNLLSEPFIFLLNVKGEVSAKFEGIMSLQEVELELEKLLFN